MRPGDRDAGADVADQDGQMGRGGVVDSDRPEPDCAVAARRCVSRAGAVPFRGTRGGGVVTVLSLVRRRCWLGAPVSVEHAERREVHLSFAKVMWNISGQDGLPRLSAAATTPNDQSARSVPAGPNSGSATIAASAARAWSA